MIAEIKSPIVTNKPTKTMDIIKKPIVKHDIDLCCECAAFCHEDKGNRPF